jgi:hypothetical protein
MRSLVGVAAVGVLAIAGGAAAPGIAQVGAAATHGIPGTHCTVFPSDNVWHADISKLPVNSHSNDWRKAIGLTYQGDPIHLHPDFGPSYGDIPVPYGIPFTVVSGSHRKVKVHFQYGSESDHVRYPLGSDTKIEGGKHAKGDRHAIIVDKSTCRLYETFATKHSGGHWSAGSGAVWSLNSNQLRHNGWTSADAAGLPILPGLLRWSEVKAGFVDHAIRFTAPVSSRHYIWPARHQAGSKNSLKYPPMGARFRLDANYSMAGYSAKAKVVLRAMKTYGLILADNGSSWYFQGTADNRWPAAVLDQLKAVPASAFVAVDESSLQVAKNSGAVKPH